MTNGISQEPKFWKSLAFGLQATNGKRGGLGGNCGWGRRHIPLFKYKETIFPDSICVFTSDASFTKIVQPAPQEDSSATEALRTNGIHQDPCFKVLQLQMHLLMVLVGIVAKRTLGPKITKLATIVVVRLQ